MVECTDWVLKRSLPFMLWNLRVISLGIALLQAGVPSRCAWMLPSSLASRLTSPPFTPPIHAGLLSKIPQVLFCHSSAPRMEDMSFLVRSSCLWKLSTLHSWSRCNGSARINQSWDGYGLSRQRTLKLTA